MSSGDKNCTYAGSLRVNDKGDTGNYLVACQLGCPSDEFSTRILNFLVFGYMLLEYATQQLAQSVSNSELKKLAFNLDKILKKARADNTLGKYETYFNKWSKWCSQLEEVSSFPAES